MGIIGISAAIVGGLGILIGLALGFAERLFAVKTDERELAVRQALPGNNCGGCGFAGCEALAKAIARGEANANACPVGGSEVAAQIAAIMGVEADEAKRQVAFIHCAGTCDKVKLAYHYYGAPDCRQAAIAPGHGGKACSFACFGLGTCVKTCPVDAIFLQDGVAVVDPKACIGCTACTKVCPQGIIGLRPKEAYVEVRCSSHATGKAVKAVCGAGCIGCGICQKICPTDAIHVVDHLARVDHEKCIACGACVEKCPVDIIRVLS